MKTKTLYILLLGISLLCSCKSEIINTKVDVTGEWLLADGTNSCGIQFQKSDTTMIGVLLKVGKNTRYAKDMVLFKEIRQTGDSTFTAKGLFLKAVNRTERQLKESWIPGGSPTAPYTPEYSYEDIQVFDHFEHVYTDYRIFLVRDTLRCIPFSEGQSWSWVRFQSGTNKTEKIENKPKATSSKILPENKSKQKDSEVETFIQYSGSVGNLTAYFSLDWRDDGTIKGTYYYVNRPQTVYSLIGMDLGNNKMILKEYTGDKLTANCVLTGKDYCYSGQMNNTDGRVFKMFMCIDGRR